MRKLTIEEVKKQVLCIHGDEIVIDESTYINTRRKARFIDKDYGGWLASVNSVINAGKGHKKELWLKEKTLMCYYMA